MTSTEAGGAQLRSINEQVVVITGAASGIGRETALQFGQQGARLVLGDQNQVALEETARQVERVGGQAHPVTLDIARWEQVENLAQQAVDHFGRVDTWVNNAAVSEYATVEQMTPQEIERIVQVILMGQIYGMKAVIPHMKRERRGTIINVASALAMRGVPLQAAYCAAKHGIKGFTESLRLELEYEKTGIKVTLLMRSSINTPLFEHARSKLGVKPMPIPLTYEPRVVAEAILYAAEHPVRDIVVGGSGKMMTAMERISPSLLDWYMLRKGQMWKKQKTNQPDDGRDNLVSPIEDKGSTTGSFGEKSKSTSIYTQYLELHPNRKRALLGATAAGAIVLMRKVGR